MNVNRMVVYRKVNKSIYLIEEEEINIFYIYPNRTQYSNIIIHFMQVRY